LYLTNQEQAAPDHLTNREQAAPGHLTNQEQADPDYLTNQEQAVPNHPKKRPGAKCSYSDQYEGRLLLIICPTRSKLFLIT
jgi:hypothetical protein